MTKTQAIDKVLAIADAEVGYLEKRSNSNLDSKTANAGKGNYTKYWRDIIPSYQAQPWCAVFVTWCLERAFGRDNAELLLKHYPYVYCPQMESLFTQHSNPERGDIVIFKRGGEFTHTGFVTGVDGDYFTTIEGNTSAGSSVIANGGGVYRKGYYNSSLPGTKFCRPEYESIFNEEELTMTQYEDLTAKLAAQQAQIDELRNKNAYYNYIDQNMNESYRPTIKKLADKGYLQGNEKGELMLTTDMMRILTILDRILEF